MSTGEQAVIYARVSTSMQDGNYSVPTQMEGCRTYAAQHGYEVVGEIQEVHTGMRLDRPGIDDLLALVRSGGAQVVLVYDLDRLTREPNHLAILEQEIENAHARVEFVLGAYAASPEGRLAKAFKAAIAQFEVRQRSEGIARGRRGRAQAGIVVPKGAPPYGYRYVSDGKRMGRLEVNEDQAEVVRRIFQWAADGATVHAICNQLNKEGILLPTGSAWMPKTVIRMLRSERYLGVWNHSVTAREYREGQRPARVKQPQERWIPVAIPRIIDDELWARVQARLDAGTRATPAQYLLTGRIFCSCGRRWEGYSKGPRKRQYYRCPTIKEAVWHAPCSMAGSIRVDMLDEAVWAAVERLLLDPEMLAAEVRRQQKAAEHERAKLQAKERTLVVKAKRLERESDALLDRLLDGLLTGDQVKAEKQRITNELEHVQGEIEALRKQREAVAPAAVDLVEFVEVLKASMADVSLQGKRQTLALLELRVDVQSISVEGSVVEVSTALGLPPMTLTLPPGRRTRHLTDAQAKRAAD